MIWIGTSGYSFEDWKGAFYPKSFKQKDFLKFYSSFFNIVEIDSTYYKIPHPKMFSALIEKVPEFFKFTVKTPSIFTHERKQFEGTLEPFKKSVEPLIRKNMLACFLAQFPFSFKQSRENLDHVSEIASNLTAPTCVEFRHVSWQNDDVYEYLRNRGIGFVNVDLPKLAGLPKPSSVVTSKEVSYIRFHGRVNASTWWKPAVPHERYNYEYSTEELKEWLPRIDRIKKESKNVFVMFNNHYQGRAVRAARIMMDLLPKKDLPKIEMKQSNILDSL